MSFNATSGMLRCVDCWAEITLDQYRRKVPRCDDCEVAAALSHLDEEWTLLLLRDAR